MHTLYNPVFFLTYTFGRKSFKPPQSYALDWRGGLHDFIMYFPTYYSPMLICASTEIIFSLKATSGYMRPLIQQLKSVASDRDKCSETGVVHMEYSDMQIETMVYRGQW